MTHPSKRKGTGFERELVNEATAAGLVAERAYASNGRALGCAEVVDLAVAGMRLQAKRRRKLAKDYRVPEGADGTVFREDHGETFVLIRWTDLLDKLKEGGW